MDEIILGLKYRDMETGFVGVATSRITYQYAEPLVHLENEHGARYFEEIRLKKVEGQEGLTEEVRSEVSLST